MPSGEEYSGSLNDPPKKGLQAIWITPLKALAVEIQQSAEQMSIHFNITWKVDLRTGDTPQCPKQTAKNPNFGLVTTPKACIYF